MARPFTAMSEKVDPDLREYALGVGAVSLAWAHHEFALDMLLGLLAHFSGHDKRHPVSTDAKLKFLFRELKHRRPYLEKVRGELFQIHVLTDSALERRNIVMHGAVFSTLDQNKATVWKLIRDGSEDKFGEQTTSILEMFLVLEMIFNVAAHTWNLIIRLGRELGEEHSEEFHKLPLIDVTGFQWPATRDLT